MIEFQHRQIPLPDGTPTIVCRIKGSIDGTTVYQFESKLAKFLEEGFRRLIIVFSQVQYINSTGMGVLVKLADRAKDEQGDFCLVEVPDRIVGLFNVLGLLKLIKLFKTEEEAIKHFQPKKPGEASSPAKPSSSQSKNELAAMPPPPPPPSTNYRPAPPKPNTAIPPSTGYRPTPPVIHQPVPTYKSSKAPTQPPPHQPPKNAAGAKPKIFAISCKQCKQKIALGTSLVEGTYKCPLCMAAFHLSAEGKVHFL